MSTARSIRLARGYSRNRIRVLLKLALNSIPKFLINAHTNYWGDPIVLHKVRAQLDQLRDGQPRPSADEVIEHPLFAGKLRELPFSAGMSLAVVVLFGPILLTFMDTFMAHRLELEDYRRIVRAVDVDPVDVLGTVSGRSVALPNGNGLANRRYDLYITFRSGPGDPPCKYPACHEPGICEQDIDSDMAAYLNARRANSANIRYRRGAPKLYYAPGYEPAPRSVIFVVFAVIWDCILACVWGGIVFKYLENPVSVFLGETSLTLPKRTS
jgi:hypothetical protein